MFDKISIDITRWQRLTIALGQIGNVIQNTRGRQKLWLI